MMLDEPLYAPPAPESAAAAAAMMPPDMMRAAFASHFAALKRYFCADADASYAAICRSYRLITAVFFFFVCRFVFQPRRHTPFAVSATIAAAAVAAAATPPP